MKTVELKASLLDEVTAIIGDEELMEKALRSIRRLRVKKQEQQAEQAEAEAENLKPYTMEEIDAMIDESEAEIAAGLGISGKEMNRRIEEYRAGLWK